MKGRNVIDGEKVERRSNQPSLPPNDSEGPLNTRGPSCLTIWGVEYRSLRILPFAISVAQVAIRWFLLGGALLRNGGP